MTSALNDEPLSHKSSRESTHPGRTNSSVLFHAIVDDVFKTLYDVSNLRMHTKLDGLRVARSVLKCVRFFRGRFGVDSGGARKVWRPHWWLRHLA